MLESFDPIGALRDAAWLAGLRRSHTRRRWSSVVAMTSFQTPRPPEAGQPCDGGC
jgi:hypothetical protein